MYSFQVIDFIAHNNTNEYKKSTTRAIYIRWLLDWDYLLHIYLQRNGYIGCKIVDSNLNEEKI